MSDSVRSPLGDPNFNPFEESAPWYRSPLVAGFLAVVAAAGIFFSLHAWQEGRVEEKTSQFLDVYAKAGTDADRLKIARQNLDLPDTAAELVLLGSSFSRAGDFASAETAFGLAADHFPGSPLAAGARLGLGHALEAEGKLDAAAAALEKAAGAQEREAAPYRPFALLSLARVRGDRKDLPGARQALQELISKYPDSTLVPEAKSRLASLPAS